MFNKNIIFIITSFFLGITITLYYNQNIDLYFILTALLISILFYIIFYFLGSNNLEKFSNDMNFNNYYKYNDTDSNNYNIFDYLEDDEDIIKPIAKPYKEINEEDNSHNKNNIIEEEHHNIIKVDSPILSLKNDVINTKINDVNDVPKNNSIIPHENIEYKKPDINTILMATPIPVSTPMPNGYGPLNINISYNSQNKANEIDTDKKEYIKVDNDVYKIPINPTNPINNNKNLGEINSRIHNNSDWVYGQNAWTNNPDYYIPNKSVDKFDNYPNNSKNNTNNTNNNFQQSDLINKQNNKIYNIPQFLNNIVNDTQNKNQNNGKVCPMTINTPWTEYSSGDSEPDPFNL